MHLELNHFFAVILILSLLVFFDLLIRFKQPMVLKMMLLFIVTGIGWNAFDTIYCSYYGYNRWLVEMPLVFTLVGGINTLSIIYYHSIKNKILIFTSTLFLLQVSFLFYFSFIHPVDIHIYLNDIKEMSLIRKIIKIISIFTSFILVIDLYYKIYKKYSTNNLYFKQLIKWTFVLIIVFSITLIVFILNIIYAHLETLVYLTKGLAHITTLLYILYRPDFLNRTKLKVSLNDTFNFKSVQDLKLSEFTGHFFHKTYYLNSEANIKELAENIGTYEILLQDYIKEQYGMTFTELVNKSRVDYFVSLVNSKNYHHYTIEALSVMCGFNSRQNLQKAFKTYHGGTPSDLIKSVV